MQRNIATNRLTAPRRRPIITSKYSMAFNGTSQCAQINTGAFNSSDYNGACTWSTWFNAAWVTSNTPFLDNAWGTSSNVGGVQMYVGQSKKITVNTYGTSTSIADTTTSPAISNIWGTWIHVLVTKNVSTTTQILYINGTSVATNSGTTGGCNPPNILFAIGARGGAGTFGSFSYPAVIGGVADVAVWNRALTGPEAQGVYYNVYPSSGLLHHWDFHENTGTTISDLMGGPSFTTVGSPSWGSYVTGSRPTH